MWPSCEKCGRLCVRFDDKLCVFHKADRGDYNRSKRGTRRKKAKQVEPENTKLVFPWSTKDGYFNGDMFEDWLNSTLDPSDSYFELQRAIKARDAKLWLQLLNEITKTLREIVLLQNRK